MYGLYGKFCVDDLRFPCELKQFLHEVAWLSMIKDISEYIYFKTSMHLGSSELFLLWLLSLLIFFCIYLGMQLLQDVLFMCIQRCDVYSEISLKQHHRNDLFSGLHQFTVYFPVKMFHFNEYRWDGSFDVTQQKPIAPRNNVTNLAKLKSVRTT